jgi:DNA segregation ATPase FtsK/SpoIIIE-like protein
MTATSAEHEHAFAPGLPGPCECGKTYSAVQVEQALGKYIAERAGSYVTAAMVQRRVRVGYARAACELDLLAAAGVIAPFDADGRYAVPSRPTTDS